MKIKQKNLFFINHILKFISVIILFFYRKNFVPFTTLISGGICLALGTTVLIGWYTHNYILYQIQLDLTPMYYNTALNFSFLGIGLIFLFFNYKKWTRLFGIVIIFLAGLTALEYILNINVGIDEFFFKSSMSFHTTSPGRMSPHTAFSFLVCGTGLIFLSLKKMSEIFCYLILLLSICVFVLASVSLLGYAAHLPAAYQWATLTPMAVHTSIGFMIASGGLLTHIYGKHVSGEINLSSTLPYFTAIFVLCLTSLLWRASLQQEIETTQYITSLKGEKIQDKITEAKKGQVEALEALGFRPSFELFHLNKHTFLSKLILIVGIFLSLLVFSTVRAWQIVKKQTVLLQKTQRNLESKFLESKQRTKELQLLKSMTQAMQACSSLEKSAAPVAQYCKLLLPSTSGILYLANKIGKKLTPFSYWGKTSTKAHSFSVTHCLALQERLSHHISDMGYSNRCEHLKKFVSEEPHSLDVCLPLLDHGGVLGLLYVHHDNVVLHSKKEHKKLFLLPETLANQLSLSISSLKMQELLRDQAVRDPLTNLFNRRYLNEILQREIHRATRYSHPVSIIMFDIDYFKNINDTLGHEVGDDVLRNIGLLLQEQYRKSDVACRFGGEEFILVLPETPLNIAIQKAEQLRNAIFNLRMSFQGKMIQNLSISLGVGTFPEQGSSMPDLISAVDQALYKAKALGRNRVEVAN